MSNCGCAGICACEFDNGETTIVEGNGRIATPFAVYLNDIPYNRPVGGYSRRLSAQSILGGTTTQIIYDTNDLGDFEGDFGAGTMDGGLSPASNGSALTVPVGGAGIYLVGGFVEWNLTTAVSTTKAFWIARNGSSDVLTRSIMASTNTFGVSDRCYLQNISGLYSLSEGDVLRAYVLTGEATSILITDQNIVTSSCYPYMYAQWMGAAS